MFEITLALFCVFAAACVGFFVYRQRAEFWRFDVLGMAAHGLMLAYMGIGAFFTHMHGGMLAVCAVSSIPMVARMFLVALGLAVVKR